MTKDSKEKIQYVFAALILALLFAVIGILLFREVPKNNSSIVYVGIGVILGWGSMVVGYFFGSSKGSADKTEILNSKNPV